MTTINNILENTKNGAIFGFQAGNEFGFIASLFSSAVSLFVTCPSYSWCASIIAGTATGAVAGLIGAQPKRPAEIASRVAVICCALPFGSESIFSQIGATDNTLSSVRLFSTIGGIVLDRVINIARRWIQ